LPPVSPTRTRRSARIPERGDGGPLTASVYRII
jgi:hypothetical protein